MAYSDFPMPAAFPNYLHHRQVLEYFQHYAEHFGLISLINFRTRVIRVEPIFKARYEVTTEDLNSGIKETKTYEAVLVCNGHHWHPKMPQFPGNFNGETIHSREYRHPNDFKGKNVLTLDVGNSGVDIACDIAPVAARTFLAVNERAIFSSFLGETALKSFHPRLFNIRHLVGELWSVANGYYCRSNKTSFCEWREY